MPIRDTELYKDKVEVSLDGRQIFYLFFGGAVIVGLVFVLGVMVGRRVEARGHLDHARTTAAVDPLAALDRLESTGGTSFQSALMGNGAASDVERKIAELDKTRAKGEGKPDAAAKSDTRPEAKSDAKVDAKPEAKIDAKVEPKVEAKKAEPKKPEPEADAKPADKKPADGDAKQAKADDAKPAEDKPRYTLQLSSFQDKKEADAFLATIKASGYQAYVTEANVSGKGTFYRVRLGTYRSMENANNAKADFEKSSKKTASIMRL